jgi:hypothetical protein
MRFKLLVCRHIRRGDPELLVAQAVLRLGDVFVDVGANTGIYSKAAFLCGAKVIAFEPIPSLAAGLSRELRGSVTVFEQAVSIEAGTANLRVPIIGGRPAFTRASLDSRGGSEADWVDIQVSCGPPPALHEVVRVLKIDVEGFEMEVLRAFSELIQRDKPMVLIEAEERHSVDGVATVRDWLSDSGYHGYFMRSRCRILHPLEAFDPQVDQTVGLAPGFGRAKPLGYINNFLFIASDALEHELSALGAQGWVISGG